MRYLALDLGERRIGVAISDPTGMLARPLTIFPRTSRVADFAKVAAIVKEYQVGAVIVGLPLRLNGEEGPNAVWVRDYSAALGAALQIPIHLWDERMTTVEAAALIQEQGRRPDPKALDAVAAAVILQGYLDAHSQQLPESGKP